MAKLKPKDVASLLHVSLPTVNNWESGKSTIPYSAYKLLRVLTYFELPGKEWQGWSIGNGLLWAPSGRSFESYQLTYIGNMFSMARLWIAERELLAKSRKEAGIKQGKHLRLIVGGKS